MSEIIISGLKTNYITIGEGTPFLILHGWGSNSDRWVKIAEKISKKGFKVIIPDLPSCGASDKLERPWTINDYVKWFDGLTRILNIENFYLLGYSFGGALASKIAVKYPQRIQKLFLVAAAVVRKKTAKKKILAKISKFIKFFYFLPYYDFFRKAVYKFIIKKSDYVHIGGIMKKTYLNIISEDISFHLPFIKVSTIIIWGENDESVPIEDAYFINKKIINSKLVVIPEAGHLIPKQMPEVLAEKIINNI